MQHEYLPKSANYHAELALASDLALRGGRLRRHGTGQWFLGVRSTVCMDKMHSSTVCTVCIVLGEQVCAVCTVYTVHYVCHVRVFVCKNCT